MTTKTNPFNRGGVIKSESSSVEGRQQKIDEMAARGYEVKRLYQYETTFLDRVATGYKHAAMRNLGESSRMKYGVVFRHQSTVEGETV